MPIEAVQVIAHGSPDPAWEQTIRDAVAAAALRHPVVVSFLESKGDEGIEGGIRKLERMGVTHVAVVPLFISSFTTHVDEIEYALGVKPQAETPTEFSPIPHRLEIIFCEPMNDHPLILEVLAEKAVQAGFDEERHRLVLAAHGVNDYQVWPRYEQLLNRMANWFGERFPATSVLYGTFYPPTLRATAERGGNDPRPAFVLPFFLSEGYFTRRKIPTILDGVSCLYESTAILPHPNVALWLRESVARADSRERD